MYRMLVLASVLSHNSKCVAEDFFLSIERNSIKNYWISYLNSRREPLWVYSLVVEVNSTRCSYLSLVF